MKRFLLPLFMFLLFIFEGTVWQVFSFERFGVSWTFVPRFTVIVIIMTGIFLGRKHGVLYGLVFGLLYDVIYTDMLGVYLFSLSVFGYVSSLSYERIKRSSFFTIAIIILTILLLEYFIYGLHFLLSLTEVSGEWFFVQRLLPTLALNLLVAIIFYYPLKKGLTALEQLER